MIITLWKSGDVKYYPYPKDMVEKHPGLDKWRIRNDTRLKICVEITQYKIEVFKLNFGECETAYYRSLWKKYYRIPKQKKKIKTKHTISRVKNRR